MRNRMASSRKLRSIDVSFCVERNWEGEVEEKEAARKSYAKAMYTKWALSKQGFSHGHVQCHRRYRTPRNTTGGTTRFRFSLCSST